MFACISAKKTNRTNFADVFGLVFPLRSLIQPLINLLLENELPFICFFGGVGVWGWST